jgi:hypothetical protein
VTQEQVFEAGGLDALMFLEYIKLFMRFCLILCPVAVGVLCPLHFIHGLPPDHHSEDWLTPLGMGGLANATEKVPKHMYWTYAGITWLVVALTLFLTRHSHNVFLQWRFKWLRSIPAPRSTTLMVEGIPTEYRSDAKLKGYFVHLFGEEAIERAYMVRKTQQLQSLLTKLESKRLGLATAEAEWEKSGKDPAKAPKIGSFLTSSFVSNAGQNAIEVYTKDVEDLEGKVSEERARIEQAVEAGDLTAVSTSAFVTFRSQRWCRLASREQYREDTSQWIVGMPPDPTDVVYEDFVKDDAEQSRGNCIGTLIIVLTFILWTPLVAMSTALTSLSAFENRSPWLHAVLTRHPAVQATLQGVLATFALKFLMSWFPTIMMTIIRNFLTLKSGAWAQLKLQNRFFIFQVTFVVFVGAVGITAPKTLEAVVDNPQSILSILADKLPRASHFYLSYVLLGTFTVSIELLRYFQFLSYAVLTRCYRMDPEAARAAGEPEDQDGCGMGARFAKTALAMTLTLVFSCIAPLIVVFGLGFFAFSYIVYAYLLVFAESKKPDLGGAFWINSLKHTLFALILFVTLMIGILGASGRRARLPAAVIAPIYAVLYLAWHRLGQFSWEILPFEILANLDHEAKKRKSLLGMTPSMIAAEDAYMQPECRETGKIVN